MKTKTRSRKKPPPLGQHFLTNPAIARALVDASDVKPGDTVLEIGPGTGALTRELSTRGARVIAIEKDKKLAARLLSKYPDVRVIEADVRDVTPEQLGLSSGNYILAANIPYYITGEIIRTFLTSRAQPKTIALLVQKEVAERIVSKPAKARSASGGKESILSLSVKAYGTPRFVKKVSAGNFSPPPSVDSAILTIANISRDFFSDINEQDFFKLVRAGFASKRKMLRTNLSRIVPLEKLQRAFEASGLTPLVRAEDVPLSAWRELIHSLENDSA